MSGGIVGWGGGIWEKASRGVVQISVASHFLWKLLAESAKPCGNQGRQMPRQTNYDKSTSDHEQPNEFAAGKIPVPGIFR